MNFTLIFAAFGVGTAAGYFGRKIIAKNQLNTVESKIAKLTEEAKIKAKEELVNAKDKAVKILEEAKKEEKNGEKKFEKRKKEQ